MLASLHVRKGAASVQVSHAFGDVLCVCGLIDALVVSALIVVVVSSCVARAFDSILNWHALTVPSSVAALSDRHHREPRAVHDSRGNLRRARVVSPRRHGDRLLTGSSGVSDHRRRC